MKSEIRQNGKTIMCSSDDVSIPVIFNNLCGKNFSGDEYRRYIKVIALGEGGFVPGEIEHVRDGIVVEKGIIPSID